MAGTVQLPLLPLKPTAAHLSRHINLGFNFWVTRGTLTMSNDEPSGYSSYGLICGFVWQREGFKWERRMIQVSDTDLRVLRNELVSY